MELSVKSASSCDVSPPPRDAPGQSDSFSPAEGTGWHKGWQALLGQGQVEGLLLRDSGVPGKSVAAKTIIMTLSKKDDAAILGTFLQRASSRVPEEWVGAGITPSWLN